MKRLLALFALAALAVLAGPASANFQVNGKFMYDDFTIDINGFQNPHTVRPVRLVDVRVIDNTTQAVLATGATDVNGNFNFSVTDASVRNIAILALTQSGAVANLNHYVTRWENTTVWAFQGIVVASHDPNTDIDMGEAVMHFHGGAEQFNLYDAALPPTSSLPSRAGRVPRACGSAIRRTSARMSRTSTATSTWAATSVTTTRS